MNDGSNFVLSCPGCEQLTSVLNGEILTHSGVEEGSIVICEKSKWVVDINFYPPEVAAQEAAKEKKP